MAVVQRLHIFQSMAFHMFHLNSLKVAAGNVIFCAAILLGLDQGT